MLLIQEWKKKYNTFFNKAEKWALDTQPWMVEMPELYKKSGEERFPIGALLESRFKWFFNKLNEINFKL